MIFKPVFKPSYDVEVMETEGVFLLSETSPVLLRGALYARLAALLDGQRSADDLVDLLEEEASPAEVYYALARLEQQGYIAEANGLIPVQEAAFWSAAGVEPSRALGNLATTAVSVAAFGALGRATYVGPLLELGLRVSEEGELQIALTDDYLQEGLADFNAQALAGTQPWLLAKPVGTVVWIGPLFHPGVTGCWECLAQRLRANREVERFLQARKGTTRPLAASRAALAPTSQVAVGLIAHLAMRWIADRSSPVDGAVLTLDLTSLETQKHALVRRPQCPSCGGRWPGDGGRTRGWEGSSAPDPQPVVLQSRKKRFTADGGHRAASPEVTIRQYQHHVSPITGVVSVLQPVGSDGPVHTYVAGHNWGLNADNLHQLRRSIRSNSGGKGMTDLQAKASGLCEAIERHSGLFQGNEPRRRATYRQLGEQAIHPNACMLYSDQQYRDRDRWNARQSPFQRVPRPFDEEEAVDWTPVWSMGGQEPRYVPTAYCYYGYPAPQGTEFCWADSNGNAAGNTIEEAALQGLLELAERDSVALWWYNRLGRPAVDLDSFGEPYIDELRTHYQTLGRELWVLDITSDLGIPSFAALSRRTDGPAEQITLGFGTHLDPRIGLLRALTEQNQSIALLHELDAAPSGPGAIDDPEIVGWLKTATVMNQPYLTPVPNCAAVRCASYHYVQREDLLEDVLAVQRTLKHLGMDVLLLDQTRPEVGLSVVKVVVPGLRHFWARLAPGRLYDVPVKMDWVRESVAEDQLNPIPMFL